MKISALRQFVTIRSLSSIACFVLFAVAGPTVAEDNVESLALKQTQMALLVPYNLGFDQNDYQAQRNAMQQIYDVTVNNKSDARLLTAAEARLILDDLDTALAMPADSLQKARQMHSEIRLGKAATIQRDYPNAIDHLDKALKLSDVYGDNTYEKLKIKVLIAAASEVTGGDLERGLTSAIEVRTELERRNMADCHLYGDTLAYLFILQLAVGKEPEAIATGETLIRLFQKQKAERTLRFFKVTGMVARYLNIAKRHEEAYRYAALGLKTCPNLVGEDTKYGLMLLRECAVAAANLNDYTQVPALYEKILATIAVTPGYPDNLKLEFLEEYAAVLEKLRDEERNAEIQREIDKIKNPLTPQKSRYSE